MHYPELWLKGIFFILPFSLTVNSTSMPWLWVISLSPHLLFIVSYHNEYTHFCREMCNIVNTRFLRPFSVITEITTKSPQKLYDRYFFGPFITPKSFFPHWKVFDLKSSKQDFIFGSTAFLPIPATNPTEHLLSGNMGSLCHHGHTRGKNEWGLEGANKEPWYYCHSAP